MTARLTRAQQELVVVLMEECGEIVQACSKMLRHGQSSHNPDSRSRETNLEHLAAEVGQLQAVLEMLRDRGINLVDCVEVKTAKMWKEHNLAMRWLHGELRG